MVSHLISDRQTQTPTWQWQAGEGLPYLTCSLLQAWPHGFFTQPFYPRTPESLTEILHPEAIAYRLKQVHGNRVLSPAEIAAEGLNEGFPSADGLIANQEKQSIWVASADCTPVLIGDVETGNIAALHAGWRGTAQKIVPEAIARLQVWGSSLENLRIALGPAISGEVYQVSIEVAAEVGGSLFKKEEIDGLESILTPLQAMSAPPILPDPEVGKVRLDVRRVNQLQLEQLGIAPEQIAIAPYCTYQSPSHFFSYRRTKEKKVQWSGIVKDC
ncbi:peptidoglycan editing factor PgeF [Crocosphaera sp. XPORK-15E]|uniref:peptidoglycan editing factor PgeF n=1 Tax=Crocosphaera sp. XPORK-15E TaxID=3110247 RepID=UPI002B200E08|nr:peptidoglycan editing factor PgeF [Crocosphaera sp. XPORK-15E]MEA5535547.1 peptidoglycan editing factor PgeF [Crocosphaera sp. XPORK-15E]